LIIKFLASDLTLKLLQRIQTPTHYSWHIYLHYNPLNLLFRIQFSMKTSCNT